MTPASFLPPTIDESARKRFEEAWRSGRPRSVADFLPPADDPRHLATLEELVHIDLEFAWKGFDKQLTADETPLPLVEHYLGNFPRLRQTDILTRLLQQEFRVRTRHGDRPTTAEYAARFPDLSSAASLIETVAKEERPPAPEGLPAPSGYQMLGELGRGGMGVVYEAREARLGRVVALKTARAGHAADPHKRTRFLAEARIAAGLEHPGIVPVHELVTPPDGDPFYTMKLVRGRTLDAAIEEFHATPDTERSVGRQRLLAVFLAVARTMAFAHSKGVIHRDLKPANIVLGDFGETVVLDWGLAKDVRYARRGTHRSDDAVGSEPAVTESPSSTLPMPRGEELTLRGDILGTPSFMAPEQAAGHTDEVDEQSDVYALGAILHQILTGHPPHRGETAAEVLRLVREVDPAGPRAFVRDVPRPLDAVCLKALARRREDRYSSAAALADDVERFLAGEPVSVYRERPTERLVRWARRHRTGVAVGAVALVLSVVGTAAALYLREKATDERRARDREHQFALERQQRDAQAKFERERALEKQRQDIERGQAEEQARRERLAEAQAKAAEADGLARAAFHAGRFGDAQQVLRGAVRELNGVGGQALDDRQGLITRLEGQRLWAQRLDEFYRLKDRADLTAFDSDLRGARTDPTVIAACEAALTRLGISHGHPTWWERRARPATGWWASLPPEELLGRWRARLGEDTAAVTLMLGLWRVKRGLNPMIRAQSNPNDPLAGLKLAAAYSAARPDFLSARDLMYRVRDYHRFGGGPPSRAAEVVRLFCDALLREGGEPPAPFHPELLTATDAYFLGGAHILLAEALYGGSNWSPWAAAVKKQFGPFLALSGLDPDTPRQTAEQLYRRAIALDPEYYLAQAELALCLETRGDWTGAEQQWTTCVALRPDSVLAYRLRCAAVFRQFPSIGYAATFRQPGVSPPTLYPPLWQSVTSRLAPGPTGLLAAIPVIASAAAARAGERVQLFRRCLDGLALAPYAVRADPVIGFYRCNCLWNLGDRDGALAAGAAAAEVIAVQRAADAPISETLDQVARQLEALFTGWANLDRANPDVWAALATAHLAVGKPGADAEVAEALRLRPDHPRALAVRGMLYLRAERIGEAIRDFDAALAAAPGNMLAMAGRAMAREAANDWRAALADYAALRSLGVSQAATGPLHLVAYLGEARTHTKLAELDAARNALDAARLIDPLAADDLASRLFGAMK